MTDSARGRSFSRRVRMRDPDALRDRLYGALANMTSPIVGGGCPHSTRSTASPSSCSMCLGIVVERSEDPRRARDGELVLGYRTRRGKALAAGLT